MDEPPIHKKRTATEPANHPQATSGLFRFSVAQFLAALIVLLVAYPFVVDLKHGEAIETALMTLVLISAVLAVGGRMWKLAIVLVLPGLLGPWINYVWHGSVPIWLMPCSRMLFVAFVEVQLLRFIVRAKHVSSEVLCAGISAYVLMGIFWTFAFQLDSQLRPGAFATTHATGTNQVLGRFDALYLAFVTLTGLGCNDITALSKGGRMMMVLESLASVLYLAVLIARLVAMYSKSPERDRN